MVPTLNDLLKAIPYPLDTADKRLLKKAYEMAEKAHKDQKRKSGDPYLIHTVNTAINLANIGMDPTTIAAGLLHDVPEDTTISLEEISKEFGPELAHLVDGVTKLGHIRLRGSQEEYFLENLRKMFLAMAADIRVVIIRLADRLHNMQTLEHLPPEKQQRIAKETMEIFAPIANRLGIGEMKGELEDLSFKYIDPESYNLVKKLVDSTHEEREKHLEKIVEELKKILQKSGIRYLEVCGRAKHLYRLFLKLKKRDMDIRRIYDLKAVRVIVPNVADCYETLGVVHKHYRPMVGRIKDYISLPKPNGYQSLHTSIFGPDGRIFEVQIRTKKMNEESEYGIAAHWIYTEKERKSWKNILFHSKQKTLPQKELIWVKQLREWQAEIGSDNEEFLKGLKIDFFKNHIFAFTPRGDIIDLPEDATPVDFAYSIHSEVGNKTTGAKADGKIVPLDYHIQNGQVIEILQSKEKKIPSRDWLKFVRTSNAKSHIRKELKKNNKFL
ncbi:MAG: bifunctional (p)ppGpp synthetase/guanosine-3',5'-bis(diphosphate) 3'-pyrophosphohydrolase [Candidatus Moraniibacteriota bacterium]|nr:MAG: bifunctional (p)ppGpp synthetase/guanosine-3',5'-bis(diphosphate) 3'-pyrophosphohydrolase [Candidatus Moranbacteria bacterium]